MVRSLDERRNGPQALAEDLLSAMSDGRVNDYLALAHVDIANSERLLLTDKAYQGATLPTEAGSPRSASPSQTDAEASVRPCVPESRA